MGYARYTPQSREKRSEIIIFVTYTHTRTHVILIWMI